MQAHFINQITAENKQIQGLTIQSDPKLIIQSYNHLRNLARAMGKINPGDVRYKLALTTLYQYDKDELDQIRLSYNKQWEGNSAKDNYLEALKRVQCTVGRAVAFLA